MTGGGAAARLAALLDRHWRAVFVAFSAVFFVTTAGRALQKPFGHDEIYTILISRLPALVDIWRGATEGLDLAPPFNVVLTRVVHEVAGVGPVITRLPAMIGFWIMCLVLFHLVRVRSNTTLALSAALLPCFTAAYRYSYEARGYGVMLALSALALYSWTESARDRRRSVHLPLLAVWLAAGMWTHYYAVTAFAPVVAGEAVRVAQRRRMDAGVLLAVAAAGLATLPLLPLARAAASQAGTFWSQAALGELAPAYMFLLNALTEPRFVITALAACGVIIACAARSRNCPAGRRLPAHEVAAGVAMLLLPLVALLIGVIATGVFAPYYALNGIVGFSLTIPLFVWWASRRSCLAEMLICTVLTVSFFESAWHAPMPGRAHTPNPVQQRPLLLQELAAPGPVVVTGGLMFLQFWYYAPPSLKGRLRYLADPAAAAAHAGTDTIDRGFLVLRQWTAVPVDDYAMFIERYRVFTVYASGSGWLLDALLEAGAALEEVGRELGAPIYVVRLPGVQTGAGLHAEAAHASIHE